MLNHSNTNYAAKHAASQLTGAAAQGFVTAAPADAESLRQTTALEDIANRNSELLQMLYQVDERLASAAFRLFGDCDTEKGKDPNAPVPTAALPMIRVQQEALLDLVYKIHARTRTLSQLV